MGISGLLPLLKSIQKPCNLKKFAGLTIGIDAYGWLHRGTIACAIELATGKPTTKYVKFAMDRVRMLLHFGVVPYLVFDGDYLPSKAATEEGRAIRREESRRKGLQFKELGKISQAHHELQKAIDVTPVMARELIEELKAMGIEYVVAPYEADAQLVYLERKGIIQGILSEDSDLLVFGAKRLLTKLDQYGDCIEINRRDFAACREVSLTGWTDADFRRMAILSGCDYLANINKMGLKTAYRLVRKHKSIEKILKMLQFDGQFRVPVGYLEDFKKAELTFLHQRVYCPISKTIVMHTDIQEGNQDEADKDMPFIGASMKPEIAQGVASGDLHPMTKEPIIIVRKTRTATKPTTKLTAKPAMHPLRRVTIGAPSDLKPRKPIDAFFKSTRIPLAELDPNSFTPSPSQRRLLSAQSNSTWYSSPAPCREPENRTPTPAIRIGRTLGTPRTPLSAPPPQKRQRLCSGSLETPTASRTSSEDEESTGVSKFFIPKKPKKMDVNIWSDDSVEAIMAEIPDISTESIEVKEKRLKVWEEDKRPNGSQRKSLGRTIRKESSTASTILTGSTSSSGIDLSQATTVTTVTASPSQSSSNVCEESIKKGLDRFRYQKRGRSVSAEVLTPETVHDLPALPLSDSAETSFRGSEDFIVPNSEDDGDGEECLDEVKPDRGLDLGRFAFKPRSSR
ncbi:MAG: Rad2 nuclease [Cirrosporium novae-zelandiae]|nr:MAG: Rad2 nuclease [Cirrosporium novae-zelandiae]